MEKWIPGSRYARPGMTDKAVASAAAFLLCGIALRGARIGL
ncbi:hypothetical protein [Bradyrhizobium iriomotense]|nr:hypothetical protein [Bradyrhizobium iriomotense]